MENVLTPYVIQTLMILTSLVLIVHIIIRNKNKWQKPETCQRCREGAIVEKQRASLHLMYLVCCSGAMIILLFVYIVVKDDSSRNPNPSFYEYFSFGSVIVSIVLAVLTIVYSYYTNSRSAGQSENITRTSEEIKKASEQVLESSRNISANSLSLTNNIGKILEKLDEVGASAKEAKEVSYATNQILAEKNSINIENPKFTENTSLNSESLANDTNLVKDDYVLEFIARASWFGKLSLLGCVYSKQTGKSFTSMQLLGDNGEYMWGFLAGASAANFVGINENEKVFNVTYVHPIIDKEITNIITENDIGEFDFNKNVVRIKKYFEISN